MSAIICPAYSVHLLPTMDQAKHLDDFLKTLPASIDKSQILSAWKLWFDRLETASQILLGRGLVKKGVMYSLGMWGCYPLKAFFECHVSNLTKQRTRLQKQLKNRRSLSCFAQQVDDSYMGKELSALIFVNSELAIIGLKYDLKVIDENLYAVKLASNIPRKERRLPHIGRIRNQSTPMTVRSLHNLLTSKIPSRRARSECIAELMRTIDPGRAPSANSIRAGYR